MIQRVGARGTSRAAPARPPEAPYLGVGVGLRPAHYAEVLARGAAGRLEVDWFEVVSENFMVDGGRPPRVLEQVRGLAPLVLHGVSMNLGSADPLDRSYLRALDALARRFEPEWLSDHLCWTGVDGHQLHDLLPLPYTAEVVRYVADRIRRVQDALGRRIAVENVSSYASFDGSEMGEAEFLSAVAEEADCGILLDVNNVYVSACNHGFDAAAYLDRVDPSRVFQLHVAGHSVAGPLRIDSHDGPVGEAVWELTARALRRLGPVSLLVEWDGRLPGFDRLCQEAARARRLLEEVTGVGLARDDTTAPAAVARGA